MRIPEHWARATASDVDSQGRPLNFSCWRWSDTSPAEAEQSALASAQRMLANFLSGTPPQHYGYGSGPVREDVLQRFHDDQGRLIAAISQNAYGALVLNTAGAMFMDFDFAPTPAGEQVRHFFGKLLGRGGPTPDARREEEARGRLEEALAQRSGWSARIYRTCAGLRALVTHELFDPAASETQSLLTELGNDPLYVRLCQAQQSFRARLTPKPWRCGHQANSIGWPRQTDAAEEQFQSWNQTYLARQAGYATCRLLATVGPGSMHPDIGPLVDLHDRLSRCDDYLPLA